MISDYSHKRWIYLTLALTALLGVILHLVQSDEPLKSFIYFTLQSNLLVVIVFFWLFLAKKENKLLNFFVNQAFVGIFLTGLVFNIMLRPTIDPSTYELDSLADLLIHTVVPSLVLLNQLLLIKPISINRIEPLMYLFFPLIYWLFTIVYVWLGGNFNGDNYESNYPYFFMNLEEYGVGYFILVIIFVILVGYFVYFINLIKKRFRSTM